MSAAVYRDEPGKLASGVMAVVVHVAFFALLVFGVSWQRRETPVVAVELWNNLPPAPAVKAPEPEPAPPKPEVKPPPPPPEPKPVQKIAPKPVPEPKPAAKPDIALEKEKQEKARRERDEREKAELKKKEDLAKAEARKKEEADKKRLADAERAKEAERVRAEREQQEATKRLQQQQAAAQSKEIDMYTKQISDKIRRYVNKEPCASLGNPEITFAAVLLPDGNTLDSPRVLRSSGNAACDQAVLRAVLRAQPLPLPPDPALFAKFRELNLQFRPNE